MVTIKTGIGEMPSVFKNPFEKSLITSVYINYNCNWGDWEAHGSVEFKNGNTKGSQSFRGKTFDEVFIQIKTFLDEMNAK